MLQVDDLHVSYGNVPAVRGVGLAVAPGRVTLVLGANGAGKTTTLRAIAGLHPPVSGRVTLDGGDITGLAAHRVVRRGVVLVPEGRRVLGPLSVAENLRIGAYTAPGKAAETVERVHEMFPILRDRAGSAAGLLSGGEQQMLAFGRALMSQPRVMLLDEPSMGLAPAVVDTILAKVREIADSGIGVLMVEQNAEAGLDVADDVVAVARGEVVFRGTADRARSDASVLRAFLGEAALVSADTGASSDDGEDA
jgi:branched-chain amino acid transport system ATP-binding protein